MSRGPIFPPVAAWLMPPLLTLLALGCHRPIPEERTEGGAIPNDSTDFSFVVTITHAKGLSVENYSGYKRVYLFDPDTRDTLERYLLYPRGGEAPEIAGRLDATVPVPAQRLITTSTVQLGAFSQLGAEESIVGSTSLGYSCSARIQALQEAGRIQDVGQGMSYNLEAIIALGPDAMLVDQARSARDGEKLQEVAVPTILFNSWQESSPLGRAEWIKLIGLLVGRNREADSLFQTIAHAYLEAKTLVEGERELLPIVYGQDYKGVWYQPGEYSYMAALLRDAKLLLDYAPGQASSQPRSFEQVFSRGKEAKIWICSMAGEVETVAEFIARNAHYGHFEAARHGTIITDAKRVNARGGNDFWESGPYRPDLLLKDLIRLTRPGLLPGYETRYYKALTR